MNGCRDDNPFCYFHPKEVVIGVCALCLNERLLILAAKQASHKTDRAGRTTPSQIPKIFAFTSLLNFRHWKSDHSNHHDDAASTSQEDSFISIKFEDNGVASWEKGKTVSKVSLEEFSKSWHQNLDKPAKDTTMTVIEQAKPRTSLRWKKRIGHLFQLVRWKRSNKANSCHVSTKMEGVKASRGWIRTLAKRRSKE